MGAFQMFRRQVPVEEQPYPVDQEGQGLETDLAGQDQRSMALREALRQAAPQRAPLADTVQEYPAAPQFQPIPERERPHGIKQVLLDFLGNTYVPGYARGKEQKYQEKRENTIASNKQAEDVWRTQTQQVTSGNTLAERVANNSLLDQARAVAEQRQREALAAKIEGANEVLKIRQEQNRQAEERQRYAEAKEAEDFKKRELVFTDFISRHMRDATPEERERELRTAILKTGGDPLQKKIETLQRNGVAPTDDEMRRMAGAAEPAPPAPTIVTIAGPDGQAIPAVVDKKTRTARPINVEGGGVAEKPDPLTASSKQLGETAHVLIPKMDTVLKRLEDPAFAERLGPAVGRWNEFMAGKVGAGDPEFAALRATIGLLQTGTMRAHVGARGGAAMMQKFEGLFNADHMDVPTLRASLGAVRDFLKGYEGMRYPKAGGAAGGAVEEWERGPDGKLRKKVQ